MRGGPHSPSASVSLQPRNCVVASLYGALPHRSLNHLSLVIGARSPSHKRLFCVQKT